jgi:hypothetical protein
MADYQKENTANGGESEDQKRKKEEEAPPTYGELIELDIERRKAKRKMKQGKREKKRPEKTWRQALAEKGGGERKAIEKNSSAIKAAIYSDLRIKYNQGLLKKETLVDFLKDFPSREEYEAHQRLENAIREGDVDEDISEMKNEERGREEETVAQKIMKTRKGRTTEKVREVKVERKGTASINGEEVNLSADEWYRQLLRDYALGELSEGDLKYYLSKFSPEGKAARQQLLSEINKAEAPSEQKRLSDKEIDEMVLGVRENLLALPSGEGKPILERLKKVQMGEFKHILEDIISEEEVEKKTAAIAAKEKIEPGAARARAEQELVTEAARKVLAERELVTHGIRSYDKEKKAWGINHYSDLDGKCAMALLQKAGMKGGGKYVPAGDFERGAANADTGFKDGFLAELDEETMVRLEKEMEEMYKELGKRSQELADLRERAAEGDEEAKKILDIKKDLVDELKEKINKREQERWATSLLTLYFDHHGPYSDRDSSATKVVYEVLTELGLLKFKNEAEKKNYEKVVEWVTQSDNFNFPGMKKHFQDSDRKMIGFVKFRNFDQLLKFAESGKNLTDTLNDQELRKFGLIFKDNKTGKTVDRPAERRETIKKTMESVRDLMSHGWTVIAAGGKRFLVDTEGKLRGEGQWAAASLGYDGTIRYNPKTQGFAVTLNEGTFDEKIFDGLEQGVLIRNSMFLQPEGREKLTVSLGDLIKRLAPDFNPGPKTELKKFLDNEPWRIKTIVRSETAEKKEGEKKEIWWWANAPDGKKVAVHGLPKDFSSGSEALLKLRSPEGAKEAGYDARKVAAIIREINKKPKAAIESKEAQKKVFDELRELIGNIKKILGDAYKPIEEAEREISIMEKIEIGSHNNPVILKKMERVFGNLEEMVQEISKNYYVGFYESEKIEFPQEAEIKKDLVEVKAAPKPEERPAAAKQEAKPAPKPERPLTVEEKRRRETEEIIADALTKEKEIIFHELLQIFEKNPVFGKWDASRREALVRQEVERRAKPAEKELRKKYGL